jgi:hypothetical protein
MKTLKIAGLCLASMLVMGMALAGTASAAAVPALWLVCLEGKEGSLPTKYTTNQCTKAASGNAGKWQSLSLPLGTSDTVRILAITLRLTDNEAGPLKEKSTITCPHPSEGWGLIENRETEGKVRAIGILREAKAKEPSKECTIVSGPCKTLEKVEGADLPWEVEIFETEKKFVSKIQPDGNGQPGWAVTCNTALGSKTDTCKSKEGKLEVLSGENRVTSEVLLVLAEFLKANKAECSEGGKESGEVAGQIAILLWKGNGLSLNPV